MGKMSKQKGSGYERKIARLFEEWSGMTLRRTPLSGGWVRQNPRASGDIVAIENDDFPFCIECKKVEAFEWEPTLHGNGLAKGWWEQVIRTCPRNRIPLLVFSRNRYDDWVMFEYRFLEESLPCHLDDIAYSFSVNIRMRTEGYYLQIVRLEDFLKAFGVKDFNVTEPTFVR